MDIRLLLFLKIAINLCSFCHASNSPENNTANVSIWSVSVWNNVCGDNPSPELVKEVQTEVACMANAATKQKLSHFLESCFISESNMRMPRSPDSWMSFYCKANDSWISKNIVDYCFLVKLMNYESYPNMGEMIKCFKKRRRRYYETRIKFFQEFEYNPFMPEYLCRIKKTTSVDKSFADKYSKLCKTYLDPDSNWKPICQKMTNLEEREKLLQDELVMINCWTETFSAEAVDKCWRIFTPQAMPSSQEEWREFLCKTSHHYALREAVRYCSTIQTFLANPNGDPEDFDCRSSKWIIPENEILLLKDYYGMARDAFANMEFCLEEFPASGSRIVKEKTLTSDQEDEGDVEDNYFKNNKIRTLIQRFQGKKNALSAVEFCWRTLTTIADPEQVPQTDRDWKMIICSGKNYTKTDHQHVLSCIEDILTPVLPRSYPSDWESRINLDGC